MDLVPMKIPVDQELKERAECLFSECGMSLEEAVALFFEKSIEAGGFPFGSGPARPQIGDGLAEEAEAVLSLKHGITLPEACRLMAGECVRLGRLPFEPQTQEEYEAELAAAIEEGRRDAAEGRVYDGFEAMDAGAFSVNPDYRTVFDAIDRGEIGLEEANRRLRELDGPLEELSFTKPCTVTRKGA